MPRTKSLTRTLKALLVAASLIGTMVARAGAQTSAHAKTEVSLIVIKAGRLLDVRTGHYAENVFITVDHGKIISIGAASPAGARMVDLSGYTVLPGLIDVHVHLLANYADQSSMAPLRMSAPQATLWGVHNLKTYLDEGFTTVRDACEAAAGGMAYGQLALRAATASGLVPGPRILAAGSCISVTGGHGDSDSLSPDQALPRRPNLADTPEEIDTVVRRDIKYGADWIKLMATGGVMDSMSDFNVQELSQAQMAEAVKVAHQAHKHVMAHAEGTEGIKAAVRAGVDSIEHGTMLDEDGAALMEAHGTWLVPTLICFQRDLDHPEEIHMDAASLAKNQEILRYQQPAFTRALKHHLKIAMGDDDVPDLAYEELGAMVRGGMTPLQTIQSATVNGASLLGLADQLGAVEPGKAADLIAVAGDPTTEIKALYHVSFVMKGGEIFKMLH